MADMVISHTLQKADMVILNDEKLRELATLINRQEANNVANIGIKNPDEMRKYLDESLANKQSVLDLLDTGADLKHKFQNDPIRAPIADYIASYIENCLNSALQTVPNYTARTSYLKKIRVHVQDLIDSLEALDHGNETEVTLMSNETKQYRDAILEYTKMYKSTASRDFSISVKAEGVKFHLLVQQYQAQLKIDGPFDKLEDGQKLQVYQKIIETSKRGSVTIYDIVRAKQIAGKAVLLFTAGTLVWDIFSAEHAIQKATHDVVVDLAQAGTAILIEDVVTSALDAGELFGVEASALFILAVGTMASIAGSFLIGAFAGWLMDLIFSSGGQDIKSTDGHKCYIAAMPDGAVLARQIVRHDD